MKIGYVDIIHKSRGRDLEGKGDNCHRISEKRSFRDKKYNR